MSKMRKIRNICLYSRARLKGGGVNIKQEEKIRHNGAFKARLTHFKRAHPMCHHHHHHHVIGGITLMYCFS
jgi:hypothetical protein